MVAKKGILLITVLFSVLEIFPLFAQKISIRQDDVFYASVEPLFGIRNGILGEYVYYSKNSSDKLSYLEWDMKSLMFYGVKVSCGWKNLFLESTIKGFIPSSCGFLQDSDWQQDYRYHTGNRSTKTNYSKHDNYLTSGYSLESEISYKFHPDKKIVISPIFGLEYQYLSFSGKDGTAWYGVNDYYPYNDKNHQIVTNFSGKLINYDRYDLYSWIGFGSEFMTWEKISFFINCYVAPFVYIQSLDSHLKRNLFFYDVSKSWFCAGKLKCGIQYKISNRLACSFEFLYLKTDELRTDDSYISSEKNGKYYKVNGTNGSSSEYFETSVLAKIYF